MGGEAFGPVKAPCPNVGEGWGRNSGVLRWEGVGGWRSTLIETRGWNRRFLEGKPGRGIASEI